jgi:Cu(I)/Ag(I) efflux system membrane protein CusA/SilA
VIARLVAFCTRRYWLVLSVALVVAAAGEWARRSLARDVVPDLSDPQIVLVATWMGHSAGETAERVTKPLTESLQGVPDATDVRGSSMPGMAYVDVVFRSAAKLDTGRRAVLERLRAARTRLPSNVRIEVGPSASSASWVYQYALVDPERRASMFELRRFQDNVLSPALSALPGVGEVASVGGAVHEVSVELRPFDLRARGAAASDVVGTVRAALEPPHRAGVESLAALALPTPQGADTLHVEDVARVRITEGMPNGFGDLDGVAPAVGGIVVAKRGANLSELIPRIERVLGTERQKLPAEVKLVTIYNRLDLIDRVDRTLLRALAEEVGVVVLVILVFLVHVRSALVPLVSLPLVLLLTFAGMWLFGVPATIMSLGGIGIALGMAVDADVVALEACHRWLERSDASASPEQRRSGLVAAACAVSPAILTSLVIAALAFLPVFAFGGETGRLLHPLAVTKTLVIVAASIVTLTVAPALRARLLAGRVRPELENPLTRNLIRVYRPFVQFALRRPVLTLLTAVLALLSCLPIISRLGGEFLPRVDEGDLLAMPTTLPGVPPDQAVAELRRLDRILRRFGEIESVFGKIGRADTATDPAPYSMAEITIRLRPRNEWPRHPRPRWYSSFAPAPVKSVLGVVWPERRSRTTSELVEALDAATRAPGWNGAWTAPVRARLDMMSTGVKTPVGVRIVAADPKRLEALGSALQAALGSFEGTRSAVFEALGGETRLAFDVDGDALEKQGVDPGAARDVADLLVNGGQLGELEHDGERLRVRVAPDVGMSRGPVEQLRDVTIRSRSGASPVPLGMLGHATYATVPASVRSERGELVAYVYVDLLPGTDLLGYVERGRQELERRMQTNELDLGTGERIEWVGQYALLAAGKRYLGFIVPAVLLSMLALLVLQFRSLAEALIVLVSVPFALVGSFWTLFLLGYPLSAPVWVGLLSTVGLAMQTGVVMVVYIDEAFYRRVREGRIRSREDIVEAHAEGTVQRLRPKIMTITTMGAGLLPLLWTDGAGAEIMKRVAAPMVGGLATSAFLTLEVLPVLYTIWRWRQLRRAQRGGHTIETVVGALPAWTEH